MLALQLAILAFHMAAAPLLLPVFHMQQAQAPLQQLRVATQVRASRGRGRVAQLVQTVVQLVIEAIDVLGVLVQSPVLLCDVRLQLEFLAAALIAGQKIALQQGRTDTVVRCPSRPRS